MKQIDFPLNLDSLDHKTCNVLPNAERTVWISRWSLIFSTEPMSKWHRGCYHLLLPSFTLSLFLMLSIVPSVWPVQLEWYDKPAAMFGLCLIFGCDHKHVNLILWQQKHPDGGRYPSWDFALSDSFIHSTASNMRMFCDIDTGVNNIVVMSVNIRHHIYS